MCTACTVFRPSDEFIWVCDVCPVFAEPTRLPDAERAAAEHDHGHHHGVPTAELHRA